MVALVRTIVQGPDGYACWLSMVRVAVVADEATADLILDEVERQARALAQSETEIRDAIRVVAAAQDRDDLRQRLALAQGD